MKTEISPSPRFVPLPMQELLSAMKIAPCADGISAEVTYPPGNQHLQEDHESVLQAVTQYMLQGMLAIVLAGTNRRMTNSVKAAFFSCCMPAPGVTLGRFYAKEDGVLWLLSWADVQQLRSAVEAA